jgi:hypothetical protein
MLYTNPASTVNTPETYIGQNIQISSQIWNTQQYYLSITATTTIAQQEQGLLNHSAITGTQIQKTQASHTADQDHKTGRSTAKNTPSLINTKSSNQLIENPQKSLTIIQQ